jgi:hypothetical protein
MLLIISVSMFLSSVFVDFRRKRQEWKLNDRIEKDYDLQIKNHNKANWHKGFQWASGIISIYLLGLLGVEQGWFDGGGIIEPDAPSNPNG